MHISVSAEKIILFGDINEHTRPNMKLQTFWKDSLYSASEQEMY